MKIAISWRPHSDQGVATNSHCVISRSYGFIVGDCLCSRGACTAFTALSRRSHCADGMLKTFVCYSYKTKWIDTSSIICLFSNSWIYAFGPSVVVPDWYAQFICWTCISASSSHACWLTSAMMKLMFISISYKFIPFCLCANDDESGRSAMGAYSRCMIVIKNNTVYAPLMSRIDAVTSQRLP